MLPPSAKPYLVRAIYEWCLDRDHTPHILVAVNYPGVQVPGGYDKDGRITLNIAPRATHGMVMDNEWISFMARFGGKPTKLDIPIASVIAVFSAETQEGISFGEPEQPETPPPAPTPDLPDAGKRPGLRLVK